MSDERVVELIERAFDYRGYVTVVRHDGTKLVGFVYDRSPAHIEMFDEKAATRIRLAVEDIADVELTGEDSAAKAQRIWERRKGALEPPGTSSWADPVPVSLPVSPNDRAERPVLILVALPMELRSVADALGSSSRGSVVRGRLGGAKVVGIAVGMGGGAAQVVAAQRPRLLISCGFSGALDPSLEAGDLVVASSVSDETGDSIPVADRSVRAARQALEGNGKARVAVGEILCATQVAATADEKRALGRPGRLAVDLESWAAARAAVKAGIPWLAIRVIVDSLDADLPAFTREAQRSYTAPALRHALGGPRAVAELARLAVAARTARRSLERALRRLGPALGAFAPAEPSS